MLHGRRAVWGAAFILLGEARPGLAQADAAPGFGAFWQDFRSAVLAGDMPAVMRLSRMPVESRGELDGEPVRRLTAATFPAAFERLLQADSGGAAEAVTTLQMIRDAPSPALGPRNASPASVRIGPLDFARGSDGWRLVRIYRGT